MQSLLEVLPKDYQQKISGAISLSELTLFSVMINESTALVGTNKKLIICLTKWKIFKKAAWYYWQDINRVEAVLETENSRLILYFHSACHTLTTSSSKKYLLPGLVKIIEARINKK